jgi:hypothetical protein
MTDSRRECASAMIQQGRTPDGRITKRGLVIAAGESPALLSSRVQVPPAPSSTRPWAMESAHSTPNLARARKTAPVRTYRERLRRNRTGGHSRPVRHATSPGATGQWWWAAARILARVARVPLPRLEALESTEGLLAKHSSSPGWIPRVGTRTHGRDTTPPPRRAPGRRAPLQAWLLARSSRRTRQGARAARGSTRAIGVARRNSNCSPWTGVLAGWNGSTRRKRHGSADVASRK